ncbi:ligase-associated DNA damage response endonuclease PdeM [Luteimonas sp. RD2P54]|uniref:Ligase-associated DNA damage response endonuclease PdeM n=1 Tax=Luteimonas endophytica TaxID=3042023 RepID=A0ABT6J9L3_9GAMM|nr:ligase-associated DNA damage response endonuclease PdeM [Luteimonas endophytica]MDH5823515.1 ligase-associated DNA damage response endonuclease PdeM [Luteimonas endophytica]
MADDREIALEGERIVLYAERALYWPRAATLVVADLHLGKGDEFRRNGLAVPAGGTGHDLDRIDALLEKTGAGRLLVLGDLLHGLIPDAPWLARWFAWRNRRAGLAVEVVVGNHDRALRVHPSRAASMGLQLLGKVLHEPPFAFVHDVDDPEAVEGYLLAGHLHPVLRLPGLPRLPAFRFGASAGVLPAFTAFAGGTAFEPVAGERVFACAPGTLVELPASG